MVTEAKERMIGRLKGKIEPGRVVEFMMTFYPTVEPSNSGGEGSVLPGWKT